MWFFRYDVTMTTATPVIPVMEYATTGATSVDPRARAVAGPMMLAAVGSGLCVAVCFAGFAENIRTLWTVAHPTLFLITLAAGIVAGMRMRDGVAPRMLFDCIAGVGILGLALVPLGWWVLESHSIEPDVGFGALGVCYLLLAGTTVRHVLMYRLLANWASQANWRGLARSLIALGWTKTIFEALWLGCCATTSLLLAYDSAGSAEIAVLFAFGSLFGCFGYAVVWLWMLITHAILMQRVKA